MIIVALAGSVERHASGSLGGGRACRREQPAGPRRRGGGSERVRCPRCKSDHYHRSHSRGRRERRLRKVLPIHYYRCHKCNHRGARFTLGAAKDVAVRYALVFGGVIVLWEVFKVLVSTLLRM
jgi:uncharacterized protein YlaI